MPHSGLHFLRFWCDLVPKRSILGAPWRPAGPKMAPKITQVVPKGARKYNPSHHFAPLETSTKKHNMLAFFTALFPSSLSERSFIQKYYANAFGKPLNPNKKNNPNIQRLNETMTIFSKTSSAIHQT